MDRAEPGGMDAGMPVNPRVCVAGVHQADALDSTWCGKQPDALDAGDTQARVFHADRAGEPTAYRMCTDGLVPVRQVTAHPLPVCTRVAQQGIADKQTLKRRAEPAPLGWTPRQAIRRTRPAGRAVDC
ncbi:hypothetical protein [Stenotrophomonas acidaminiphila]|uniref:hypothetical protein n=1 Tax=Stenotrophomonas acidaminiphila TaxID=128780 RepID=UPI0024AE428E|nr:hypothetical protein [Stenotrophomonas acidaminiphila]WHL19466.1 hypothetical protein QLF99_03250 [Stenotrophomonas acidaminiphila]